MLLGKACILVLCLTLVVPFNALSAQAAGTSLGTRRITYGFPTPEIDTADNLQPTEEDISLLQNITGQEWLADEYVAVTMGDLPLLSESGRPVLPVKSAMILLPYSTTLRNISVNGSSVISAVGSYMIQPGQEPYALSEGAPSEPTAPDPAVYNSPTPYPDTLYSNVMLQNKDGYQILIVTLHPVQYTAETGTVFYYNRITVEVTLDEVDGRAYPGSFRDSSFVEELVDDPGIIETYPTVPESANAYESHVESGDYEYVIITNDALKNTAGPYNFQSLMDDKTTRGITATIVTTEWIYANYDGTRPSGNQDNQTKVRNFIIDAYNTWGTKYVLLGGDADGADVGSESGDNIVPSRGFIVQGSYVDANIPTDMYYGCLDGTFDYDGDGYYGEPTDGPNGGMPDLFAEVYIGRACVDSAAEVHNFVRKTLAYQNTTYADENLRKVWMVGEYLGFGGPAQYANNAMNEIKEGSGAHNYTTVGFENSDYSNLFDVSTIYDADGTWPRSEIVDVINDNAHIVNHLGHANVTYVMKMYNATVDSLTNDELYFIGYSQGCYSGSFDNRSTCSTCYGPYDCISEHLTTEDHGAVAYISNSRYGWGRYNSTDGASQHYNREFWDAVLDEDIVNIGIANQDSKEDNAWRATSWVERWCMYELTLFGDPELSIKIGNIEAPDVTVTSPNGGECLAGSTVCNITWTATDTDLASYPITIDYNNGLSWSTIATGEVNDGSYIWTVPGIDIASAIIRVCATDLAGNIGYDITDDPFSIDCAAPTITLTSPIGGERLIGGTTHTITWTPAEDTNLTPTPITLQYYNGSSWAIIANGETNDGSYTWTIPGFNISTAKVRAIATDMAGNLGIDESTGEFSIDSAPAVTVTSPNGGEAYVAGSTIEISWTVIDLNLGDNPITIEYYDGSSWTTIATNEANDSGFYWTVPAIGVMNALIKVTAIDVAGNVATDQSDGTFAIDAGPPMVEVTSPNGGECWGGGTTCTIAWTAIDINFGATPISIEYYNGSSWITVATNELNDGSYSWTVPELNLSDAKIRVTAVDAVDNSGCDESDAVFSIDTLAPSVTLTSPNGGDSWSGGNTYDITWDTTDNNPGTDSVTIEYYNGSSWVVIADELVLDEGSYGTYSWTVPSINTSAAKVKISVIDLAGNSTTDESDIDFTIDSDPSVTLISPNGGQYWAGGSSQSITWVADDINLGSNPITIEYYDGLSWTTVAINEANDGSYTWIVPSFSMSGALIRVTAIDVAGNSAADQSDNSFSVDCSAPTVTLTTLDGDDCLAGGSFHAIQWTATDDNLAAKPITLEYYNGSSWVVIISNYANFGTYYWTVPNIDVSTARIRVTAVDTVGNTGSDQSNHTFTIDSTLPVLNLTSPNGGQLLVGGSTYEITWNATDNNLGSNPINLYYVYYHHSVTIATTEANDGSYIWTVPNINGSDIKISMSAVDQAGNIKFDESNEAFTIDSASPNVQIWAPLGGEVYTGGNTHTISWIASDMYMATNPISIEYYDGSSWTTIATGETNDGYYTWTVPTLNISNAKVRVSAVDVVGHVSSSESPSPFTIDSAPEVIVTSPNGGEYLIGGSSHNITWTVTDANLDDSPITLAYYNGATWITIATGEANDGSYSWRIPHLDISNAKVKITAADLRGNTATDESDSTFTIDSTSAGVTVNSPNGGEHWGGGYSHAITWDAVDTNLGDESITIEYHNGSSWVGIATNEPNDGSYTWTVVNIDCLVVKVRVTATDMAGNISSDESDNTFTIDNTFPVVAVIHPSGGQYWPGGSSHLITWTATDANLADSPITIEYYDGSNWATIATGENNDGMYTWTVPNIDTSAAKIRVSATDAAGNTETVESNGNFTIDSTLPTVTVTSANGGEYWVGGSLHNITWRVTDTNLGANAVTLEYYNGSSWVLITAAAPNNGSYSWIVPGTNITNAKIRVSVTDMADNTGSDQSDADFTIDATPNLAVTGPNGGDYLQGGILWTISWTATNIDLDEYPMVIEYYNGSSWTAIAIGEVNDGGHHWTIPNINTSNAKVRVSCTDVFGNSLTDESDEAFTIDSLSPSVTVTGPNGGECCASGNTQDITWIAADDNLGFGCIDISYYDGSDWLAIAAGEDNDGSYTWTVPEADLSVARVMITATDLAGNSGTDRSDGNFAIDGTPISTTESDAQAEDSLVANGSMALGWGDDSDFSNVVYSVNKDSQGNIMLNWSGVSRNSKVKYVLEIDDANDFSSPVISEEGLSASAFALSSPDEAGTYYWRIKAIDKEGNESAWSTPENFAVDASSNSNSLPFGLIMLAIAGVVIVVLLGGTALRLKLYRAEADCDSRECNEEGFVYFDENLAKLCNRVELNTTARLEAVKTADGTIGRLIHETLALIRRNQVEKQSIDLEHPNTQDLPVLFAGEKEAVAHMMPNITKFQWEIPSLEKIVIRMEASGIDASRDKTKLDSMKTVLPVLEELSLNVINSRAQLATIAVNDAKAYLGFSDTVDHSIKIAEQRLAKAEEMKALDPDVAMSLYSKAWENAQLAMAEKDTCSSNAING